MNENWVGAQLAPTVSEMRQRIALLEYENRSLKWREITEKDLPKVGDEVLDSERGFVGAVFHVWPYRESIDAGWTHFRPINPPLLEAQ